MYGLVSAQISVVGDEEDRSTVNKLIIAVNVSVVFISFFFVFALRLCAYSDASHERG